MGVFNIGGGGGKAGQPEEDSLILDKPYDVEDPLMDEMFAALYKGLQRTQTLISSTTATLVTAIAAAAAGSSAGATLTTTSTSFTNAQILTLNSAPITVVTGVAGKIIVPLFVTAEIIRSNAYSASRNLNFVYDGDAAFQAVVASSASFIANTVVQRIAVFYPATWVSVTGTFNPVGAALKARTTADITGGGAGDSMVVRVTYLLIDDPNP
jgi:hypothetical protein